MAALCRARIESDGPVRKIAVVRVSILTRGGGKGLIYLISDSF